MDRSNKTIVNSWNEWDPLKHVIVGCPDMSVIQAPEPAIERDFSIDGLPIGMYGRLPEEMEEKGKELMDNFAKILEKLRNRAAIRSPTTKWCSAIVLNTQTPTTAGQTAVEFSLNRERYLNEDYHFISWVGGSLVKKMIILS